MIEFEKICKKISDVVWFDYSRFSFRGMSSGIYRVDGQVFINRELPPYKCPMDSS